MRRATLALAALLAVAGSAAVAASPLLASLVDDGSVATGSGPMTFRARPVHAAASLYWDLYEPSITVAPTGAIYVAGHTTAVDTFRSPAFVSHDDGATWRRLPDPVAIPDDIPMPGQGAGQGNEGVIAADGQGRAWMWDAALHAGTTPVYSWCRDGRVACGIDPLAYDFAAAAASPCGARAIDRPWIAHAQGKLLLVLNGANRDNTVAQFAIYDPDAKRAEWNYCAGVGGRPGPAAYREADGVYAIPQVQGPEDAPHVAVLLGTSPTDLRTTPLFGTPVGDWFPCGLFNTYAAFSAAGTLYVAAGITETEIGVAASADLETHQLLRFPAGGRIRALWISGSPVGEGALLTWAAAPPGSCDAATFHAAHVRPGADGAPRLENVTQVTPRVGLLCGHYSGSALGPDGRAYVAVFASPGGCLGSVPRYAPLTHRPLTVYVQAAGPTG